jgi:Zn-dependent peptidase ImmA (M78 family)
LERGFKAWCERFAAEKRVELGLQPFDPLCPFALAKNLGVRVWTPKEVPGMTDELLEVLLRNDGKTPSCWSALTLVVGSKVVVILNSSHSAGRQASDLMHELAHRIRGHRTEEVGTAENGTMLHSSYDKAQEEEADWLSGCLLLPREALVSIKRKRLDNDAAAELFGVSKQMLNYRMAMSGVNRQFA